MKPFVTKRSGLMVAIVLSLVFTSTQLFAQADGQPVVNDLLGVTVSPPDGWELVKLPGNDKSIASYRHAESGSQLEVIGTKLINSDMTQVFFDTFHQSLLGADFVEFSQATDTKIGTMDGKQTEYSFEHTGLKLRVVVFSFTQDDSAFLVIGYFEDEKRDTYYESLKKLVEQLKFS